jgi:hypothetical protein
MRCFGQAAQLSIFEGRSNCQVLCLGRRGYILQCCVRCTEVLPLGCTPPLARPFSQSVSIAVETTPYSKHADAELVELGSNNPDE